MSSTNNSQYGLRLVYENARKALTNAGLDAASVAKASLTQSYLALEQAITNTQTSIPFPILTNDTGNSNAVRPTERRLKQQDAFYCSSMSLYLMKATSATDYAMKVETYPNIITFPTGAAPLEIVYNGFMRLTVNNDVVVPALYNMDQRNVPQTQLTAATNSPIDEFDGFRSKVLEPNWVLIGSKDNQLAMVLPGLVSTIDTFSYYRVVFRGVLAQNVTVVS